MALTAWETYVEDRAKEAVNSRLAVIAGSPIAAFVAKKFEEEIKRLHNPSSEKTRKLFLDYLGVDVTTAWTWPNTDAEKAKKTLDEFLAKRGAAAHRSDAVSSAKSQGHLVKREDLERIIRFLKTLVERTETAL